MSMQSVSPREAHQRLGADPSCVLIDVRSSGEFASGHAAGARCIPLHTLTPRRVAEVVGEIDDRTIQLICASGARSRQGAAALIRAGMTNVINVEGGTRAWKRQGLPVESDGRRMLPLDRQVQLGAGLMALVGGLLGFFVHHWFFIVPTFVGFGLTLAGATGWCTLAVLLAKMPWNHDVTLGTSCCATAVQSRQEATVG